MAVALALALLLNITVLLLIFYKRAAAKNIILARPPDLIPLPPLLLRLYTRTRTVATTRTITTMRWRRRRRWPQLQLLLLGVGLHMFAASCLLLPAVSTLCLPNISKQHFFHIVHPRRPHSRSRRPRQAPARLRHPDRSWRDLGLGL